MSNQPVSVLIGGVGPIFWTFQKRYPAAMTGLNEPQCMRSSEELIHMSPLLPSPPPGRSRL